MRFLLPIIFFTLVTHLSHADTITLKSGSIIEGKIISETHELIKVTSDIGMTLTYYQDEIDSIKKNVAPPLKNGIIKTFYLNGKTYKKENWENGVLHGISKEYDISGNLIKENFFKNGNETLIKEYYENGTLKKIIDSDKNYTYYDEEGILLQENKIIYLEKFYNKNGEITKERIFQNNIMTDKKNTPLTGEQTYKHNNGKIFLQENYKNGILHGPGKIFSTKGVLLQTVDYENGINVGINQEYYQNGQIKTELYMKNGAATKKIIYDKAGKIIYSETFQL